MTNPVPLKPIETGKENQTKEKYPEGFCHEVRHEFLHHTTSARPAFLSPREQNRERQANATQRMPRNETKNDHRLYAPYS